MAAAPTPNLIFRWNDLIKLGLKMHPIARDQSSGAKNLHKACLDAGVAAPTLNNASRCSACKEIIDEAAIVKGFMENGGWTTVSPAEIKALAADTNKEAELLGFFPLADLDLKWYGTGNFLGPNQPKIDGKLYMLLYTRLKERQEGALVAYTGRGRDKIGIIRAGAESLEIYDGYFPAEQRTYADQFKEPLAPVTFSKEEQQLGDQLIEASLIDVNAVIAQQKDRYFDRVEALLAARRAGLPMPEFEKPVTAAPEGDLLTALRASLNLRPGRSFEAEDTKPPVKMEEKPAAKPKGRKRA